MNNQEQVRITLPNGRNAFTAAERLKKTDGVRRAFVINHNSLAVTYNPKKLSMNQLISKTK